MGIRRGNGTGSIYKMNSKNLRKPYKAMITIGWTEQGRPIRKSLGTFAKAIEAQQALAAYYAAPLKYEAKKVTFATVWEWLIKEK